MRKVKQMFIKSTATFLALIIFSGVIPSELISEIDFEGIFSSFTAMAEEVENELSSNKSAGSEHEAPECSFIDELYDGDDAIKPLPSYKEYKESTGYTEPKRISFTDFREKCGVGFEFDLGTATSLMSQEYKLMICNAEELYNYSMLVNGAGSDGEILFYLSANIVLGDNIEYSEMSYDEYYFLPIGNEQHPFTGTFNGQGFEIRDLYINKSYSKVTVAFFGVVGEGATVENFGVYHPTANSTKNNSTLTATIAAKNYGTIDSVYAIVQEYRDPTVIAENNIILSANAKSASGLVAENFGTLSNSYFAGMLEASDPVNQHPVCAINSGDIINCYYDSEVFASGLSGKVITDIEGNSESDIQSETDTEAESDTESETEADTEIDSENIVDITALSNINLKRMNGMIDTKFKVNLAAKDIAYTSTNATDFCYPHLYGFTGTGTEDDPLLIFTPADLIYFPTSVEYCFGEYKRKYFQLANCIDMNEVAPNAYKPKLEIYSYTNTKSGNNWVQKVTTLSTKATFRGIFSGAAYGSDENCCINHVTGLGNDADGNPLQECHAILNLTINTPANASDESYYTAFIPYAHSGHGNYFPTIKDLHFIGGEISSGDTACMTATYNANTRNVITATVVGMVGYVDMTNVHNSATVKAGTGDFYNLSMGSLMGFGSFHYIKDCTNSGDIIGGYHEMPGESYKSESFLLGGLLGNTGPDHNYSYMYTRTGKLTHVANYGNVYAVVPITDSSNGWTLTGGSSTAVGITTGNVATSLTRTTEGMPGGDFYIDDSYRADRIANFGTIFDGPIVLDENGDPVFDADGKPQALPLDEGKVIVGNRSKSYQTYLYGIGNDVVSNSYNAGNFYSIMVENCRIYGIGLMSTVRNTSLNQLYNFLNYNVGNIYMYVGGIEAHGIAQRYAYKCYSHGGVYLYGGVVKTETWTDKVTDYTGTFSGVSGLDSAGCYFDGEVYVAPSAWAPYRTTTSLKKTISLAGVSQRYSTYLNETNEKGKTVIIPTINNGKLTVDLEGGNFDPTVNTTYINNHTYLPHFYMQGTGLGSHCYNYGKFSYIPSSNDINKYVKISIASIGGLYLQENYSTVDNSINYADISFEIKKKEDFLNSLEIYGLCKIGNSNTSKYTITNSASLGDISFKGYTKGTLTIYSFGWANPDYRSAETRKGDSLNPLSNNINLSNVSIDDDSYLKGDVNIYGLYLHNGENSAINNNYMHGWYDGCNMPGGIEYTFKDILNKLDKSRIYGRIDISGAFNSNLDVAPVHAPVYTNAPLSDVDACENIIGNGYINVSNTEIKGTATVRALANGSISNSENYTPINVENVLLRNSASFYGGLAGYNNVNYAPFTITRCLTIPLTNNTSYGTGVSGITSNMKRVDHCENRGNITVTDCKYATVDGVEYKSPALDESWTLWDGSFTLNGIGKSSASNTVNFGDIYVSDVHNCYISGLGGTFGTSGSHKNCYNYGDITCVESGGFLQIGGIVSSLDIYQKIASCYNYGKIYLENPTSYLVQLHPNIQVGGICGRTLPTNNANNKVSVISSVNYGEIIYNNAKGENRGNSSLENTRQSNMWGLSLGGIIGYHNGNVTVNNSMNYADITVLNEDNMRMFVGGICGQSHMNSSGVLQADNLINYGNITVPSANLNMGQYVYSGGIMGYTASNAVYPYKYMINYGTVRSETQQATNTFVGALCGYANNNYTFNHFTDLSDQPSDFTYYPLIGGVNGSIVNSSDCVNYTKNEQSIDDTTTAVGDSFGTVKQVTLDKNEESGMFSANFVYRSKLMHQITNGNNSDNGLMYQDYNELSPYLQRYMVEKFGEDIKNYGAYVVIKGVRSTDDFVPGEKVKDENENSVDLPGSSISSRNSETNSISFYDKTLIDDEINPIYSSMVSPSERSMYTDYNIYAQQVDRSSMAEVYESNFGTIFTYANTDTTYFQDFSDYQTSIETHPAINENGEVSDTVLYTDINIYIAVDDIDSYTARRTVLDSMGEPLKDENGNIVYEYIDTNGYIYITDDLEPLNKKSTIQYYKGDVIQETARLTEKHHYKDHYPEPWLTSDNLNEKLAVDGDWGSSLGYTELNDDHHDGEYWSSGYGSTIEAHQNGNGWLMAVPLQSRDNINNIYTKVIGVETAEDGVHKNIIVAHVIIDYFKPYATLDSVTLKTPSDGNVKSTTENGLLIETENMPSITDGINGKPKNDVNYYYLTDGELKGQNIQRYDWEQTPTHPQIQINTFNMDENGRLYYDIYWQDRLPADGELYNDLRWNKLSNGELTRYTTIINPTDIEYDEQQKSTGTATITLNNDDFYYGGYYKVNLYYERTKESDNKKHFATVFIAKQHSPINVANIYGPGAFSTLPVHNGITGQNSYDTKYGIGEDGYPTGYNVSWYRTYTNNAFGMTYYDREVNDCLVAPNAGYNQGYGY